MHEVGRISLGNWSQSMFQKTDGTLIQGEELLKYLESECNPYKTNINEGFLVVVDKEELDALKLFKLRH